MASIALVKFRVPGFNKKFKFCHDSAIILIEIGGISIDHNLGNFSDKCILEL